ncbi:MAG TPA: Maf family protein [Enhygromyxa sp.]|nr:Maf family protein [Enhygromyxa sp.]
MPQRPLVLASASPRRAELLRSAGVEFTVHAVDCDERWLPGERAVHYAVRVATAKALAAAEQLRGRDLASPPPLILAADTTVWFGAEQEPLQKPVDRAHATAMLRQLTGGEPHRVTTACAFARPDHDPPLLAEFAVTTVVRMRTLDERQFAAFIGPYLDAGDWTDKAGGYAIQGRAAGLVEAIDGSYTSVVGLPLAEVLTELDAFEGLP